jgi:sialidase-1
MDSQHIAHKAERIEGNPHKKDGVGAREQTVNNPVAIVDRKTGAIELLYCVNYARCFSMRSTDDGITWSAPQEITASFEPFRKKYDWKVIATGPGHGIQLKSGRLVVPIWLAYGGVGDHAPSACGTIFSDDHGRTWQAGDIVIPNEGEFGMPNESILTTLSDGRVMMVTRSVSKPSRKLVTISTDGASGWSQPIFHDALWEPICMAGLVTHPSGVLLFSNPANPPTPIWPCSLMAPCCVCSSKAIPSTALGSISIGYSKNKPHAHDRKDSADLRLAIQSYRIGMRSDCFFERNDLCAKISKHTPDIIPAFAVGCCQLLG